MAQLIDISINWNIFSIFLSLGNYFSIEKINLELIRKGDLGVKSADCSTIHVCIYSGVGTVCCVMRISHQTLDSDSIPHFPFSSDAAWRSSAVICIFFATEFHFTKNSSQS